MGVSENRDTLFWVVRIRRIMGKLVGMLGEPLFRGILIQVRIWVAMISDLHDL